MSKQHAYSITNQPITDKKTIFTSPSQAVYSLLALAKSRVSRRKLNHFTLANSNTPLNRVIFVCSTNTSKQNQSAQICADYFASMVACNGQPLAVGCDPRFADSYPVTRYRQTVGKLAVALKKSTLELSAMLFKFLILGEKRLTIRIRANSEQEARRQLNLSANALCIARFSTKGGIYA